LCLRSQHDKVRQPPIYEAKMSLQHAAKHLEKHGRDGDTVLVHMSKGEVKSLNDLAMAGGGQLTINPHTGLPEAGFLKRMLPMVIGAGLAATGVGAPMAAALVGGGYAAATGSLKKGLMAGLGAYGGAGIGSALATSGTAAAATTPSVSLAESAAATPPAPVVASGSPLGGVGYTPPAPVVTAPAPAPVLGSGSPMAGVNVTPTPINAPLSPADQTIPANSMGTNFRNSTNAMFEGAKTLTSPEGRTAFMTNLEAVPGTFGAKTTLAAAAAPMLMPDEQKQETPAPEGPGQQYTYSANPTNPFPTPDPYGREQKYFSPVYTPRMADGGMARGGISHLGDYSDGGRLLRGPGDGVSDSIPAVIGKKQPARLADGEFVIPARIVSELGNGSTEAGARKLYAMMDRIQKARGKTVGKGKVAKNSRSEKYLPA
jgi:hypothetical protein